MSKIKFPRVGMRMIKTAISVFICFIVFILRGDEGSPIYALIAAMLCIQTDVENSKKVAANRTVGTFVGGFLGTLFLVLERSYFTNVPNIYLYIVISIMIIPIIYITVLIKMPSSTTIACTVFLIIATSTTEMNALVYSINRIVDTLVGIFVSLVVNSIRLPRINKDRILFVIGLEDIILRRNNEVSPTTVIKLNQIISRDAIVTFASENTPALFLNKIDGIHFNYPVIVMNGAAIYDMQEKIYVKTWEIDRDDYIKIIEIIEEDGYHAFVNSVKNDTLCIFYKDFTNHVQQIIFEEHHKLPDKFYIHGGISKGYNPLYLTVTDTISRVESLKEKIEHLNLSLSIYTFTDDSNEEYCHLGIYAKGVSKGSAIGYLKAILEADSVVSFGDRFSDVALLENSDKSYALAQSHEIVKQSADEIIGGNSDGVARKIHRMFLMGIKENK